MTKEAITYLRTHLLDSNPTTRFTVIADNMIYFRENMVQLIWDDDRELLWALRQNQETRENYARPIQIQCTAYESIQYIGVDFPIELGRKVCKNVGFDSKECMDFIDSLDLDKHPPI